MYGFPPSLRSVEDDFFQQSLVPINYKLVTIILYLRQRLDACTFQAVVERHADACVRDGVYENQVVFGFVKVVHECVKLRGRFDHVACS